MAILPAQTNLNEPTYELLRQAARAKLRAGLEPQAQRISQSVRAAGVRTSGVGLLPGLEAERNRSAAELGLESNIAGQRLGQLGSLEQINLQGEWDLKKAREMAALQDAAQRRIGNQQMTNALIGAGGGALGGWLGRA